MKKFLMFGVYQVKSYIKYCVGVFLFDNQFNFVYSLGMFKYMFILFDDI